MKLRPDQAGPRASDYGLALTVDPDRLRDVLTAACGIMGIVRKRRTVRLVGRTRVHLDEGRGPRALHRVAEARGLLAALGILEDQVVSHTYIDLSREAGRLPAR
jgi:hypothetical protein